MADDELLVTISGPAFSLLLYENRRIMDQIGFLLGEILVYVTKKVTDVDREIVQTKYHINIKSIVAYPLGKPFFDSIGKVFPERLESVLGESAKNVVGWYHFREEFPIMNPTTRDRGLHEDLTNFFKSKNTFLAEENFLFCILTSLISEMGGTHKFKHLLMRKQSTVFKPVSLKISNLGTDAIKSDGSDYKPRPTHASNYDAFNKVYSHISKDLKNASGAEAVRMIQNAADNLLEDLIPKVSKSDQLVSELENKLFVLRDEYFRREYSQRQLQVKMDKMEVESKSDTGSQPKSPETLELRDIEKSPEPNSNVRQAARAYESLVAQQTRSSSSSDSNFLCEQSFLDRSKNKQPVNEYIKESAAKSKSSHSKRRSPEFDDGDT